MDKEFDNSRYMKEGWDLFRDNMANFIVATIIFVIINVVASWIPFIPLLVSGPLTGGLYYIIRDLERGKDFEFVRIFDGFKMKFVPLVLVGILTMLFTMAGLFVLILPGILVSGWYLFAYLYVIEDDLDFWPAMEASRKIGFQNHMAIFLLALVVIGINVLGVLFFFVGIIFTLPYSFCVILKAYDHLKGDSKDINADAPPPPPPLPPI